jgi:hypothetical protein
MKLQIFNKIPGHYEIIESIIIKHKEIIGNNSISQIYLKVHDWDTSFREYIKSKYPRIIFDMIFDFDFHINCSVYPKHFDMIKNLNAKQFFFISHDIHPKMTQLSNVFYLTPLGKRFIYADKMAFQNQKKMNSRIAIYVVQGHLEKRRRNIQLLLNILEVSYKFPYIIKVVGKGELDPKFKKYKHVIHKSDKDFQGYHKEFLDCYCILPLTLSESNPQYYKTKLTSSINYARGYKLKCLCDQKLQNIYKLPNVECYTNEKNIVEAFRKTLHQFYKSK